MSFNPNYRFLPALLLLLLTFFTQGCSTSVQYVRQEKTAKYEEPLINGLLVVAALEDDTDKSYTHSVMHRPVNPVGSLSKAAFDTVKDYNIFKRNYYYSQPISDDDLSPITNKFDGVSAILQGECELYKWNKEIKLLTRGTPHVALAVLGANTMADNYLLGLNFQLRLINPKNGKIIWTNTIDRQFQKVIHKNIWTNESKLMGQATSEFIDEALEEVYSDLIDNIDDVVDAIKE